MKKRNDDIVISCPIKNDNEYLIEFTEHYLNLGFDKIYFYDNNDDDTIQPKVILKQYIKNHTVVIVDYRNSIFNDVLARNDFFRYYNFAWVLFVDDDEFLELKKHKNIREFLATFSDDVTKIALNNVHYGDNEKCYYEDGSVQGIFKTPLPFDARTLESNFNSAIKSLLKKTNLHDTYRLNGHSLIDDKPYFNADNKKISLRKFWNTHDEDATFDTAYIKHYCTKSLEEFVKCKMKRAKSNNVNFSNRFSIDSYYFLFNVRTKEKEALVDYFIAKYL